LKQSQSFPSRRNETDAAALKRITAHLVISASELNVEVSVLCRRLQAFHEWALCSVVPLTATSSSACWIIESITSVVHAYHAFLHPSSTPFNTMSPTTDGTPTDVISRMTEEYDLFARLYRHLQDRVLLPAANIQHVHANRSDSDEHQAAVVPTLSFPTSHAEIDRLDSCFVTLQQEAQAYKALCSELETQDLIRRILDLTVKIIAARRSTETPAGHGRSPAESPTTSGQQRTTMRCRLT
jgi:hypothetical protein